MDTEDIYFVVKLTIILVVVMVCLSLLIGIPSYKIDKNIACPKFGRSVNLDYKYDFWAGGCFVNYEGQWIPSHNLRAGKLD